MREIRFAVMGAAKIARKFVEAASFVEGVKVVAVASKDIERAKAFAIENGIERYALYQDILDMADVDAVYIATTQNFHKENVRMCLESGKHVLCEKAMFLTVSDAEEMFALAKEKGLFMMEAMWTRFLPQIQAAKKWIEDGKIGEIQSVSTVIGFVAPGDHTHRLVNPALGGGAMYDIGVYAIEGMTYLVNQKITDVKAVWRKHPTAGTDHRVAFILNFENVDACVQLMFTSNAREFMFINGTEGYIEFPNYHMGDESILFDTDGKIVERVKADFPNGNGFVYEIEEVAKCIREGKTESDVMPWSATIEAAWVYDRVFER
ncbi:MAG: Gfo/Idh/MocA family oxidoreductase [Clostridia bacterium]|nr:Gfo/Idh/MocA family oxidoreductase [Clostridia bacterium]